MAITWAQRLKRVFQIDIESCEKCKGPVRILACVEDPETIRRILDYLRDKETTKNSADSQTQRPPERAPPQLELFV